MPPRVIADASGNWVPPTKLEETYPILAGNRFASVNRDTAGPRSQRALPFNPLVPVNLYSLGTPNGQKVGILLEELGIEYAAHTIDISGEALDQFTSGFTAVNPNSKIPCLLHVRAKGEKPVRVFESGAILAYLSEFYGSKLMPALDDPKRPECLSWLMWQMANQGVQTGNFGHFFRYAPANVPQAREYGAARYGMEVRRLLDVLDQHLSDGRAYILGDAYSVADIACFPWTNTISDGYGAGDVIGVHKYKHVNAWRQRMLQRPAVRRGLLVNSMGPGGHAKLGKLYAEASPYAKNAAKL